MQSHCGHHTTALHICFPHSHSSSSTPKTHFFKQTPIFHKLRYASSSSRVLTTNNLLLPSPRAGANGEMELELLGKPSPLPSVPVEEDGQEDEDDEDLLTEEQKTKEMKEALAPFLKFFTSRDAAEGGDIDQEEDFGEIGKVGDVVEIEKEENLDKKLVEVEYYDPKPGDLVLGVVVSGNENKLDVNVGADMLGTMLTKEVMPLNSREMEASLCDLGKDVEDFLVPGKIGIVKDDDVMEGEKLLGRPVVEIGTVLFAEVLGRTLSGRPLLSTRRMFRRVAWHRVRQIKHLNEPFEVRITEWNTGGLLTRIEGLRAFLPKAELMNRVNNFTDLKQNVGRSLYVCISSADEENNDLIISEREAWDMKHLQEGTLLEGTIRKIFSFGAQVMIGESNRSGLLHISNITRARIESVNNLLKVGDKVKVLVVKSMFPEKISLSIAELESEPGLLISDKERVFSEAEVMAKKYRSRLPAVSAYHRATPKPASRLPFDDESRLYSNWKWFKFEKDESSSG